MELSNFTMQVLKNFATVNSNVVIKPGNTIMTMAEAKNVLGQATVSETFAQKFGIYDLQEFLNVLGLVDSPRVRFEPEHLLIGDSTGRAQIKYFFSDTEMLTSPTKPIKMPEPDVTFSLDLGTLNNLKRAAGALGHSQMSIRFINGLINLAIIDPDNSTSNTYSIDVDGETTLSDCNFIIDISNLKLIASDYKVEISTKLISQFTSLDADMDLKYWIACEKTSDFKL